MDKARYYYGLGVEAMEREDFEESLRLFRISLKLSPHFKTYHRIAHISERIGSSEDALYYFAKAYEMNRRNDKAAYDYAAYLFAVGESEQAEIIANSIIERNATYAPAHRLIFQIRESKKI